MGREGGRFEREGADLSDRCEGRGADVRDARGRYKGKGADMKGKGQMEEGGSYEGQM